jgi:predicted RNase H-like HicB family nuclease
MTSDLEKRAEKLANRPYTVEFMEDETTDGEPIFVVSHPELPGCMAQGETLHEALQELEDARKEYILSLLEDGLPVPQPLERRIGGATSTSGTHGTWLSTPDIVDITPDSSEDMIDQDDQQKPTTISVVKS